MKHSTLNKFSIGWVVPMLWLLGSLAILSAILRIALTSQALLTGAVPTDPGDIHYIQHPWLTALHVVPGLLFLLLGPLQFLSSIRSRWPKVHRISGRVFVVSGLITAVTAMTINIVFPPFGGLFKSLAVFIFSIAQIITLILAVHAILRRNTARHRAWMVRAFAIGLSISTMRFFFIPAFLVFGMKPTEFNISLGMWVGFLVNMFAAEIILWRERTALGSRRKIDIRSVT